MIKWNVNAKQLDAFCKRIPKGLDRNRESKEWAWCRAQEFYKYIRFLREQAPGYLDDFSEYYTDLYFAERIWKHFIF